MTISPPPRVLMFVPQYPYPVVGGLERQSHELSKALLKLDVAVHVLSGKINSNQPGFEHVEGVPVMRIPWAKWKPVRFLRAPFNIVSALWQMRSSYDVIHLHQQSWVSLFVILVAKLIRKPTLTKLPNVGDYGIPGLRSKPLGKLRLAILLWSDGIVAMSRQSIDELHAVGYSDKNILQTPNGIRLNVGTLKDAGHQGALCRVIFVGRLNEQKRLDTLLTAWRQVVAETNHMACLELWGDGPLAEELESLSRRLGLSKSVRFLGHVDHVRQRLPEADIFVLPSCVEGNSNAILEAMEAGLPIVATSVGGTPMQVGAKGKELLFNVGDNEALAQQLLSLIRDVGLRRRYGETMRQRAEQYFDIDNVAERYRAAYGCLACGMSERLHQCGRLPE